MSQVVSSGHHVSVAVDASDASADLGLRVLSRPAVVDKRLTPCVFGRVPRGEGQGRQESVARNLASVVTCKMMEKR